MTWLRSLDHRICRAFDSMAFLQRLRDLRAVGLAVCTVMLLAYLMFPKGSA